MKAAYLAAAALLLLAPAVARADCVWSELVTDSARSAAIRPGAPRTYFVQDGVLVRGCPNDSVACRARAYLTPGDVVLTGPAHGDYTCAGFVGARGVTSIGWLPTTALSPLPEAEQVPGDWNGQWRAPEQEIDITAGTAGALRVTGNATWGMGDPGRRNRGAIHTGEVVGEARPLDGVLAFAMGDDDKTLAYDGGDEFTCRIRLWRRGPYLLARDNNACGGLNVSFSGFYRRKA